MNNENQLNTESTNRFKTMIQKDKSKSISFRIIKYLFIIFLYAFLFMSFLRVPYIGTFFDSIFFSFLFGWGKYFIYFVVFLYSILFWFPKQLKKVFNKKFLKYFFIIFLLLCLILSAISLYTTNLRDVEQFKDYYVWNSNLSTESKSASYITSWIYNDWKKLNNFNNFNQYGYGGIISLTLIVCIKEGLPAIVIIVCTCALVLLLLLMFNKKFTKLQNKFKKKSNNQTINENNISEMLDEPQNVDANIWESYFPNKTSLLDIKNAKIKQIKNNVVEKYTSKLIYNKYPNINTIEQNGIDFFPLLSNVLTEFSNKLKKYFKINNVDAEIIFTEIMFQSISVTFKFDDNNIYNFISQHNDDINSLSSNKIIIHKISNNIISFINVVTFNENNKPIVSIRDIIQSMGHENKFCVAIGKQGNRKSYYINTCYEPNLIIYGGIGSGRAMLLSSIILSMCFLNSPKNLDAYIIDTTQKTLKQFETLTHVNGNYFKSASEAMTCLESINDLIQLEEKLFINYNVDNIYAYNLKINNNNNILKNKFIIINDLKDVLTYNYNKATQLINNILNKSYNHGISLILTSSVINDKTILFNKYMNNIVIMKVDSIMESQYVINMSGAELLCGNGDMLLSTDDNLYHLQMAYVNKNMCTSIIKVINDTYESEK